MASVGARLTFTHNDPWEHHVRGSGAGVAQFTTGTSGGVELRLAAKTDGQRPRSGEVTVNQPGAIHSGRHLHASMLGHVYVSESPWADRTGA